MDPKFMSIQPVTAPVIGVQGITQSTVQGQQWGLPNPNVAVTQSVDLIVASQIGELKQTAHLVDSADTLQSAQQWSHPTQPIANIATTPLNQQWGQSIQPINISATAPFNQLRGPTQPLIGPTTSTAQQWNQPIQLIAPQLNQHSLPIQPSQSNQLVQLSAQLAKSTQQLWNQPNQPTIAQGQGWVVPPATVVPSTLVSNNQPQWGQTAALNQSIPSQQQCGQPSQQWNQLTQQMQSNWSQSPQPQQWNQSPTQLGQWNTQGQQNWNQSTSCSNWNQPMNQQQNWGQTNQQSAFNQPLPQPLNAQTLAAQVSQQYYSVGYYPIQ
jgi:hypothetical protein